VGLPGLFGIEREYTVPGGGQPGLLGTTTKLSCDNVSRITSLRQGT
jgi:hypothetical protein